MTKSKLVLPILLLLNLALRLFVALRPLKYIDGLTLPDDAYLCLTLAKNIARGLGPLYGMDYTNGFQPLYVFLISPLYRLFPDNLILPVHGALLMLVIFDTATLYMLYRLVKRESLSPYTPLLIALAWIMSPYSTRIAVNGMETSVAMFFVVASFYILRGRVLKRDYSAKYLAILGAILGAGILARIDIAFLMAAFAVYLIQIWAREGTKLSAIVGRLSCITIAALAVYLPYVFYQFHYTGDLVPVSGEAVRYMTLSEGLHKYTPFIWYLMMFSEASLRVLRYNGIHIMLAAICVFMLWRKKMTPDRIRGKLALASPLLLFSIAIFAAYAFYIMGPWFYPRYLYPISLLFLIYLAVLFDSFIVSLSRPAARTALAAAFIAIIALTTLARPSYRLLFNSTDTTTTGYMNLGLWARDNFPDSTVVGSSQTGALGYFATNLKVVNLDGVVNRKCFESLKARRNMDYIRKTKIEYVIGWDINIDFIKWETANFKDDDLIFVEQIEGFQSWWTDWMVYKVNYGDREK